MKNVDGNCSNSRRLAALKGRKNQQSQQNELIQRALLSNAATGKVTKFSDSEEEETPDSFDILHDVEDDKAEIFTEKPQFFGTKGEKMMSLQSKIGADDRFQLDERFQSDPDSDFSEEDPEERELSNEREVLYGTMNSVLSGMGLDSRIANKSASQPAVDKFVRFDPTDDTHQQFLVDDRKEAISNPDPAIKEAVVDEVLPISADITNPVPAVDSNTFYEVKANFNTTEAKPDQDTFSFKFNFEVEESKKIADSDFGEAEKVHIKQLQNDSSDDEEPMDTEDQVQCINKMKKIEKPYFFYSINPNPSKQFPCRFVRTKTQEEIQNDWIEKRQDLTAEYKKRHKDAIRFQKKITSKVS